MSNKMYIHFCVCRTKQSKGSQHKTLLFGFRFVFRTYKFIVLRLRSQAFRSTHTYSQRSECSQSEVGQYLGLGAVVVAEGGHEGPFGPANIAAALSYCKRCLS